MNKIWIKIKHEKCDVELAASSIELSAESGLNFIYKSLMLDTERVDIDERVVQSEWVAS